MKRLLLGALTIIVLATQFITSSAGAGGTSPISGDYKLLDPISHGDLTVFPVVSNRAHDTSEFITLDEGIRSGDVVVTEMGNLHSMMHRRPQQQTYPISAQVNRLVLVNNSQRPLLLLAGEIVTGGKQDRVVGKDRIVPAESDPVDLSVFCVEPGRWVPTNGKYQFDNAASGGMAMLAAPAVRAKAMGAKDQQQVWDEVRKSQKVIVESQAAPVATGLAAHTVAGELSSTTSYARVMSNKVVQEEVDKVAAPIQRSYESLIRQLRDKNAVGVVVAVNGEIVWADIFASTQLLLKYWPKLVRSYASEAVVTRAKGGEITVRQAQRFLDDLQGRHETADTEPGVYRQAEITGNGFRVFELTSLLPKTGFAMHVAKMA